MRVSTLYISAAALLAPLAVSASPLPRTTDTATIQVLTLAAALEAFETQFYQQALQTFNATDFTNAGFASGEIPISTLTTIQSDESTHVSAVEGTLIALGGTPLNCTFNTAPLLTDVPTMVTSARLIENVGVGGYLGAVHLVDDPRVLTVAASIATIESRHQTILNLFQGATPIAQPFDIPLTFGEVIAIVTPFIRTCQTGIKANVRLAITNTGAITAGTTLQFSSPAFTGTPSGFHCQMLIGGANATISLPIDQCVVPQGINGAVAVFITPDAQPLNGNVVDRQNQTVVAGPAMTFIDAIPDPLGSLVRNITSA